MQAIECEAGRLRLPRALAIKGELDSREYEVPKIGGKGDMARFKGSNKVGFTGTNRPFGRVSAMIPRGDILNRNIFGHEQFV
jgi:hypothetical protein